MLEKPKFLQGICSFEGKGLANPGPLAPPMTYKVPTDKRCQLTYFRAGNSSSELIYFLVKRDGNPMRYFPVGAKSAIHIALAVTEDNPTARRGIGSALFRKERFREALPHLEQAARLDPNDAHSHYSLGRGFDAVGRPQDAFAEYQAAVRLDEAYLDAQNDLGLSLVTQGQFAAAEQRFARAIAIDPSYASGYGNLGMLYARTGRPEKAIALCERALQLDPGLLQCNQTIATVLAGQGRFDAAIARLESLLRAEPDNQDARTELHRITALKARQSQR